MRDLERPGARDTARSHGGARRGGPPGGYRAATACAWLLAAAALLLAGCATTSTRSGEGKGVDEASESARRLAEQVGFVEDARLTDYVVAVGTRISAHAKRPGIVYRFHVLDMAAPNALALPNGNVYVSRGLLVLVNSEDELAGAMAHELAHVEQDHARGRSNVSIATAPIRIGTGIAGFATGIIAPDVGEAITSFGETASDFVLAPYSRDQERDADDVGQQLMVAAGYDPAGLSRLLDVMARAEALDPDAGKGTSFLATHPATAERVSATRAHARELGSPTPYTLMKDRAGLLDLLAGLPVGPDSTQGFFDGDWFIHPKLGFALRFPAEWEKLNTPTFVGAKAADDEVFLTVSPVATGADPIEGARILSTKVGVDLAGDAKRLEINGLPAAVNQAQIGNGDKANALLLTWISHAGVVYEIMGLAPLERYPSVREELVRATTSFRALTKVELGRVQVVRLTIVEARAGETLAELGARAGSVWPVDVIAVVNAREIGDALEAGDLVKVAVSRPVGSAD